MKENSSCQFVPVHSISLSHFTLHILSALDQVFHTSVCLLLFTVLILSEPEQRAPLHYFDQAPFIDLSKTHTNKILMVPYYYIFMARSTLEWIQGGQK